MSNYFFINVWGKSVFDIYFTEFGAALTTVLPVLFKYCYKYCYGDNRNERGRFGALKSDSSHHFFRNACTVFTVFRLLTDFVCLYTYEFWLSLCKIVRSSVILLLPLYSSMKVHIRDGHMMSTLVYRIQMDRLRTFYMEFVDASRFSVFGRFIYILSICEKLGKNSIVSFCVPIYWCFNTTV